MPDQPQGSPPGQRLGDRDRRTPSTYRRPGLHPEAETVLFPATRSGLTSPPRQPGEPPPDLRRRRDSPAAWAGQDPATDYGTAGPGPEEYRPPRRRTWISRGVLVAILCMQAVLSLHLRNTAFEDEALYLYAGHMELAHFLYGTGLYGGFASYFSGAPVLYPVLGAAADSIGGLAAARLVSLAAMLITTALLYSLTRRLFNERTGLCAALVFSVTEPTIFLGHLATYDAPALCLLAFATWFIARTAAFRYPVFLLAAPVVALAVATKYAVALFVPTIALLPALAAWPRRGRLVLAYPACFALAVALLLLAAINRAGPVYVHGVEFTTTARFLGRTPTIMLLRDCLNWGAVPFALSVLGTAAYTIRPRTEAGERIAPPGSRWRRASLGIVLTGTALLVPAEQIRIHTETSLAKHIGFGLFFAAPMAGLGLARLIGDHFRRAQVGVAVWGAALVFGIVQADAQYGWPNSSGFTRAFSRYLQPGAHYLVEVPEVPIYYLRGRPGAQPYQFASTYAITYADAKGQTLTGDAGFAAAIRGGYFHAIAYNGITTPATDRVIARALQANGSYRLANVVLTNSSYGRIPYYIWVKR